MNETCKKHVDSCRFCWMCRHICPIGNATGLERNNARARALGISLVNRGAIGMEETADNLYECALCGACTKECVTGWDPVMFTKAARLDAALEGKMPPMIERLVDTCIEKGNAYGAAGPDEALAQAIAAHAEQTDTLLFLGVDVRAEVPQAGIDAIRVLEKSGAAFTVLADEPASGWQLDYLVGAADETKRQMQACAAVLNGFARVIAFDPQDARVFKREYVEWDVGLTAQVQTFTACLDALLAAGKPEVRQSGKHVVFQDPFQLARDLSETEPARRVIAACAVCDEMLLHGRDTMWAGNLLMREWMPDVMEAVARERIRNALCVGADTIVTASVSEYASLKAVPQTEVSIVSLEELLLQASRP